MIKKQWWTVVSVYDDSDEEFLAHAEAKTAQAAVAIALQQAEGVLRGKPTVFEGRHSPVRLNDDVVPIRGKGHEIEVTHVRITHRKMVIPGRCAKCKHDFRKAEALREQFLVGRTQSGHLLHNNKDFVPDRYSGVGEGPARWTLAALWCGKCLHPVWEGIHDGP